MISLFLTLALSWQSGPLPGPPDVRVANERVVLITRAGVIVIAMYPEVAPRNFNQVMKMVSAGVYDGTCIARIEKNFVMQISAAESDRVPPLDRNLQSLIVPIPAEFSKLKHVRGTVSMAREDKDVNSARTSFSILLGPAPHLDNKYTIIGHVEYGMDVVDELVKAPLTGTRPTERLTIKQAGLVTHEQLLQHPPKPAEVIFSSIAANPADVEINKATMVHDAMLAIGVMLMICCALIPVILPKLSARKAQTVNLIVVLIGVFLLVALLQPISLQLLQNKEGMNMGHAIAIVLFFGLLGMFRLMSSFESAS